jgi:hypothetical protein
MRRLPAAPTKGSNSQRALAFPLLPQQVGAPECLVSHSAFD